MGSTSDRLHELVYPTSAIGTIRRLLSRVWRLLNRGLAGRLSWPWNFPGKFRFKNSRIPCGTTSTDSWRFFRNSSQFLRTAATVSLFGGNAVKRDWHFWELTHRGYVSIAFLMLAAALGILKKLPRLILRQRARPLCEYNGRKL